MSRQSLASLKKKKRTLFPESLYTAEGAEIISVSGLFLLFIFLFFVAFNKAALPDYIILSRWLMNLSKSVSSIQEGIVY